jgi:integrase
VKTRPSDRVVPLPDSWVQALRRRRAVQAADRFAAGERWIETDLVFTTRHGTPIEPRNFARTFEELRERAGVRRIRLHDTRHMCATLLAPAGTHPRTIMAILGHSRIAVTMNVSPHVTTEDQRAAVGLVGGLLERLPGVEEVTRRRQSQPSSDVSAVREAAARGEVPGQRGGPKRT